MGYLAMNRLFKSTVEPIVKKHLNQSKRYIMTRHFNRSRQKAVGTRRQSSESGNPRSPNGENTWDVPVFGKRKESDLFTKTMGAGTLVFTGMSTWMIRQQQVSESESKRSKQFDDNHTKLSKDWRDIADSRKAVLHQHDDVLNAVFPFLHTWNVTNVQSRHGGATTTNKSTAANTKPAPESFLEVIRFFIEWKRLHDDKTIDSANLKNHLLSDFDTFHKVLTEVREKEAKSWHKIDKDRLRDVLDFLDKISKMD